MAKRQDSDPTSLGALLLLMGTITIQQLQDAVDFQQNSCEGQSLGDILLSFGFCSKDDIDKALSAQAGLRSKNLNEKAEAAVELAQARKKRKHEAHRAMVNSGASIIKKMGYEYTPTPIFGIELAAIKR